MAHSAAVTKYKRKAGTGINEPATKGGNRRGTPLTPYEFTFCEWLACQPTHPSRKAQLAKLQELYNPPDADGNPPAREIPVDMNRLRALTRRPEFQEYYKQLALEELERSRAMFIKRMPQAVATHFMAMDMAMINKDYRSIPSFTNPVLDRVMPKKSEQAPIAAVKIELTTAQQSLMDIPEATVEVVEIEDDAS
jgi:hypothetical protein